jgi:hypothetical protein
MSLATIRAIVKFGIKLTEKLNTYLQYIDRILSVLVFA